jgi:hypothetical protein
MAKKVIRITEGDLHRIINESVRRIVSERRNLPSPKKWNIDGAEYEETNKIKGGGAWHPGFRFKRHDSHQPHKIKQYRLRKDGYRYAQDYSGHPRDLHRHLTSEGRSLQEAGHMCGTYEDGTRWTNSKDTWRGIDGTTYIWHGEWADPEVWYDGEEFSANQLEDYCWDVYKTECQEEGREANEQEFNNLPKEWFEACLTDFMWGMFGEQ